MNLSNAVAELHSLLEADAAADGLQWLSESRRLYRSGDVGRLRDLSAAAPGAGTMLIKGLIARLEGDAATALEHLQQVEPGPWLEDALVHMASILLECGDVTNARAATECLTHIGTRYMPAYATLLHLAGDSAAALDEFASYFERHPDDIAAMFRLAGIYEQLGARAGAELMYGQVLASDPRNPKATAALEALTTFLELPVGGATRTTDIPSDAGPVVIFLGESRYGALRDMSALIGRAFLEMGLRIQLVDLGRSDWQLQVERIVGGARPYLFLGMNGYGAGMKLGGASLFDKLDVPYVAFYVDAPYFHAGRIKEQAGYALSCFIDREHANGAGMVVDRSVRAAFVPHGAVSVSTDPLPLEARSRDVVFCGSCGDPNDYLKSWDSLPQPAVRAMREITDRILSDADRPPAVVLSEAIQAQLKPAFGDTFTTMASQIDLFVRAYRRTRLIESLGAYPLTVFGEGWDHIKGRCPKVSFEGSIDFGQMNAVLGDTRIVLNLLPNFSSGLHERILNSMAAGAVSLSDRNDYLAGHFEDGRHILYYEPGADLAGRIDGQLADLGRLQQIADNGRAAVGDAHLWRHRVAAILHHVAAMREGRKQAF